MTKLVSLIGVLVVAFLTLTSLLFTVLPTMSDAGNPALDSILSTLRYFAAINGYNDATPLTRTGPVFQLWFVFLLIAIVHDIFIRPGAKAAASAFAASLSPEVGQVACKVMQHSDWGANLRTTTSGNFHGRSTTVLVSQQAKISFLEVEMACRTSSFLCIRKRNLASEAGARVGAPVKTAHDMLDRVVIIQWDAEP